MDCLSADASTSKIKRTSKKSNKHFNQSNREPDEEYISLFWYQNIIAASLPGCFEVAFVSLCSALIHPPPVSIVPYLTQTQPV